MPDVRVLSFHAPYRCRHAGACCTSNWPIPIEADRLGNLRGALATGAVRPAATECGAVIAADDDPATDPAALLGRAGHRCVFFDDSAPAAAGRCRIHAGLGHDALPLACRQFPRVSVLDPRGVSVTLSHYCPTAAGLLEDGANATRGQLVVNAAAFPPSAEYSGLDAREALPPLLRPGMLMDWESWWTCERLSVDMLLTADRSADGLAQLRAVVDELESWSPADGPLVDRVHSAFRAGRRRDPHVPVARLVAAVHTAIPADLTPPPFKAEARPGERALGRFLAAHAFANWAIHVGAGLRSWLRSIEAASALIDAGAGIRAADLRLRHLADTQALCNALAKLTTNN